MKLSFNYTCQTCGKEFTHDRTKPRKYCSLKCRKAIVEIDMVGKQFGRLFVISEEERKIQKSGGIRRMFKCGCKCGNIVMREYSSIKGAKTPSCGCFMEDFGRTRFIHQQTGGRLYYIWSNMKERCINPNNKKYRLYGAKGIKVCERWMTFNNFYQDVKEGYSDNLTLDRFPNKRGDYEPGNFRWATRQRQNWNLTTNIMVDVLGISVAASELCNLMGYRNGRIQHRIKRGWEIEDAIFGKGRVDNYKKLTELKTKLNVV